MVAAGIQIEVGARVLGREEEQEEQEEKFFSCLLWQ